MVRDEDLDWLQDCMLNPNAGTEQIERAKTIIHEARNDLRLLDLVTHSKSPCGHWSAYAHTEDGGKRITCLICENARLLQLAEGKEIA